MIARFEGREVDFDRVEIRADGEVVPAEPQVFDVLAYLIERRDRMVTKEELLDNIWGDRFVSESALSSRIKSARQVIGDSGRAQTMIKTIHGRGYRFVASVEMIDAATVAHTSASGAPVSVVGEPPGSSDLPDLDAIWPLVGRHDHLAELERRFRERQVAGVLITGPAGIGKTRLARECLGLAAATGVERVQISGHTESRQVPFAAVSHLLPADVIEAGGVTGDLASAMVFQRARSAFADLGGGDRVMMVVDNVGHLDDLTAALIGSLLTTDTVFVVMTQRTVPGDVLAFDELIRSGRVAHIELGPLDDTDLDVLLYRVLAGPIDLRSLEHLTRLSRGRPGALQQLVETCRSTGALDRRGGVWRLIGPVQAAPRGPGSDFSSVEDLSSAGRAAAELLAIAGELDLDLTVGLIGDDVLDELDRARLLALTEGGARARVSLANPNLALEILGQLGPLRARRHKARLVEGLQAFGDVTPSDRVRLVRWTIETGADVDRFEVVEAARFAASIADASNAEVLIDHLEEVAPGADVTQVRAELSFRLGQVDTAEQLLADVDLDQLDPATAATAIRRRATIMFHVRGRYLEAVEMLLESSGGSCGDLLKAHAVGLSGFLGYVDEVSRISAELPDDLAAAPAMEVLRGRAQACVASGGYAEALALVDEHHRRSLQLDPGAAQAGTETMLATQLDAMVARGEQARAVELLQAHLPTGRRTLLAWLPLAAGRVYLAVGRPLAAREVIMTPLAAVRSQNLIHAEPLMTGLLAQATAQRGDADAARAQLHLCEPRLEEVVGNLWWTLASSVADAWIELGNLARASEVAVAAADDAASHGATAVAAELLMLAGLAGAADEVITPLAELAVGLDGPLWDLRIRHIGAIAGGVDSDELTGLAAEYRRLGAERLARLAEREARSAGEEL